MYGNGYSTPGHSFTPAHILSLLPLTIMEAAMFFLACLPPPAVTTRAFWQRLSAVVRDRVVLVDGNAMFNRPGTQPRLSFPPPPALYAGVSGGGG